MKDAERQVFTGKYNQTYTLPDPHLSTPGTILTVANVGQWQCVHEGDHAFWERTGGVDAQPIGCG